MIQCKECEHFHQTPSGDIALSCDPFRTIKEPECLAKWQLLRINQMVQGYQATLEYYHKLAPLQEKMFHVMERELDDIDEAEKWKQDGDDELEGGQDPDESSPSDPL